MAYASRRRANAVKRRRILKMDKPIKAVVEKCEQITKQGKKRYSIFKIPKRNGKLRTINAPSKELKAVSKELLRIVDAIAVRNECDVGFIKGKGYTDATHQHLKTRKIEGQIVINIDLENFFPSITDERTIRTLTEEIGLNYKEAKAITKAINNQGGLVQGNPVSPALASLSIKKIDHLATEFATSQGGTYTRYADDLTIMIPQETTWRGTRASVRKEKAAWISGFINRLNFMCETKINRTKVHVKWPRRDDSTAEIVGVKVGAQGFVKSKRQVRRAYRYWVFLARKKCGYYDINRDPKDNRTPEEVIYTARGHRANAIAIARLERAIMRQRSNGCYGTEIPRPKGSSKYRSSSLCTEKQKESRRRKAARYRAKHKLALKQKRLSKRLERKLY